MSSQGLEILTRASTSQNGRCPQRSGPSGSGRRAWVAGGLLLGVLASSSLATPSQVTREPGSRTTGVVAYEIAEGSALEQAGLAAGDLVLAWERLPTPTQPLAAQGDIDSPFDWQWLAVEQAPRGTVRLRGEHQDAPRVWTVGPGSWEAKVRPTIPPARLAEYLRGRERVAAGDLESGTSVWEALADREQVGPLRCWLYLHAGDAWYAERAWKKAETAYRSALLAARKPGAKVAVLEAIGQTGKRQSDFDNAEATFSSALEIYRQNWGEGLGYARGLNNLGTVAWLRGQFEVAAERHQQALEIRQELAPGSLDVATSLNLLGVVESERSQLDQAAAHFQQALEIKQKLAPDSLEVAKSFNSLGNLSFYRGQLDVATEYYRQSLEIRQQLAPGSKATARSLNNLGLVAFYRGELDIATEQHERTLAMRQQLEPDSIDVAASLNNLGLVAWRRGQVHVAAEHLQRALSIQQALNPDGSDVASSLNNLGALARSRGQLDEAAKYIQQALESWQRLAPGSLDVALSLSNLGDLAHERGQFDIAEQYLRRAFEIQQRLAPGSLEAARSLHNLGKVAHQRGQLDVATELHQRALSILEKLAPGSIEVATLFNQLGTVAKDRGQLDVADDYFERSLATLKAQIGKLGASQMVQGGFRAQYRGFYRDYIELLLLRDHPEEAFAVLERSRARSFLALLEERDLIFSDVPEDLHRQGQSLAARHDQTLGQLASLSATADREQVETLQGELDSLYWERDALRAKIRQESPHLTSLQEPQPLALADVQKILDPGTVMLSYSVGEEQTDLFVVTPGRPLTVHTLAVGEDKLNAEIGYLRELIEATKSKGILGSRRQKDTERVGKRLYELLVEPAQDVVATGDRVVLVPDGPLHRLPFAALIREIGGSSVSAGSASGASISNGRSWQYLTEWKPLHSVLSATVYAELQPSRHSPARDGDPLLAAFGDPHYSPSPEHRDASRAGITDVRVRSAHDRCQFDLRRLPASRREVLEISSLYRNVRTYLGAAAREESVKSLDSDTRIVHIAAHACLDDRFPLDSGLFLTLPEGFPEGRENGLLQTWEIFESVRLDADLVVLSACQSGLGEEQGGEGLIGLTRAFQYAGARTVAATLWRVEDQVTAELMVRFYRHLRGGKTKDGALQAAQIELIRSPIEVPDEDGRARKIDASAPYYWAAFQLHGNWQ